MISYTIIRNEETLLVKATDERFNCYRCVISVRDPFVINFCGGTLEMMESLLKDNEKNIVLQELEDEVAFVLTKPIQLKYKLRKEKVEGGEQTAMILGKIQSLMERLDMMDKRTQDLEEQLSHGVIIPGYGMGVVPVNSKELYMTFGKWENRLLKGDSYAGLIQDNHQSYNNVACNYQFEGTTLAPIKHLKELETFSFGSYDDNRTALCHSSQCPVGPDEFAVLSHCKSLKNIIIIGTNIADISWVSELKELETICLNSSPKLTEIRPLLECPNLKMVTIKLCPSIRNIPNFPSSVSVNK